MSDIGLIAKELNIIQKQIDSSEDLQEDTLVEFNQILSSFRARLNAFVEVRQKFEKDIQIMEDTIKFARQKKKDFEEYLDIWDKKALIAIAKYPKVKFTSEEYSFATLRSSGIVIEDENKIPAEFLIATTVYKPDKRKIKEAIDAGQGVPGAILEDRMNLKVMKNLKEKCLEGET